MRVQARSEKEVNTGQTRPMEYDRIMDTKPHRLPGCLLKLAQKVRFIGNGWR